MRTQTDINSDSDITNLNSYDDEGYIRYSNDLIDAILGMWDAGASLGDIENTIDDALSNI